MYIAPFTVEVNSGSGICIYIHNFEQGSMSAPWMSENYMSEGVSSNRAHSPPLPPPPLSCSWNSVRSVSTFACQCNVSRLVAHKSVLS